MTMPDDEKPHALIKSIHLSYSIRKSLGAGCRAIDFLRCVSDGVYTSKNVSRFRNYSKSADLVTLAMWQYSLISTFNTT